MCQICPICVKPVEHPYRRYNGHTGQITEGCVHPCHDQHLPGLSNTRAWAMRKEIRQLRKSLKKIPVRCE